MLGWNTITLRCSTQKIETHKLRYLDSSNSTFNMATSSTDYNDVFISNLPHINRDSKLTEKYLEVFLLDFIKAKKLDWSLSRVQINMQSADANTCVAFVWLTVTSLHPAMVAALNDYPVTVQGKRVVHKRQR